MLPNPQRQIIDRARDGDGCPSRFDSSIEVRPETACSRLFLVFEEQDFMDHRNSQLQGEIHESGRDASSNEVGVRCFASQDNTKSKNRIELLLQGNQLHRQGDLE
jgi:hypothetical protein